MIAGGSRDDEMSMHWIKYIKLNKMSNLKKKNLIKTESKLNTYTILFKKKNSLNYVKMLWNSILLMKG